VRFTIRSSTKISNLKRWFKENYNDELATVIARWAQYKADKLAKLVSEA